MARVKTSRLVLAGALVSVAALAGCRGDVSDNRPRQFLPDLDDQPKYKAQVESTFFDAYVTEDGQRVGRAGRLPVFGTVAFGAEPYIDQVAGIDFSNREEYLRPDDGVATGKRMLTDGSGQLSIGENGQPLFEYLQTIPVPVTRELIELGEKKYNINCLPCHGGTGEGNGLVGRRWAYALPNFHDAKYQPGGELGQDGYLFHVIRNGVPNPGGAWELKMPSYGRKLTIEETWAIVSYFRALQLHRKASPDVLPESMRLELERKRASVGGASGDVAARGAQDKEASS